METVVMTIMALVIFSFVLKMSGQGWIARFITCAVTALFTVLTCEAAASQPKTQIADWLSQPELMLDMSVWLTIDVAFQTGYCILAAKSLAGPLGRRESMALAVSRYVPGLLVFPVLFAILTQLIFSLPGVDFAATAWSLGACLLIAAPLAAAGLRWLVPENEIRLELLFMVNMLIAALGVVATVNGRTAAAGTNRTRRSDRDIARRHGSRLSLQPISDKKTNLENKMNVISNILYWISTGLLVPVIVLLIFFFIRSIILIGAFFGQYLNDKRVTTPFCEKIQKTDRSSLPEFTASLPERPASAVAAYASKIIAESGNEPKIDMLLSEYEIEADKNIATSKVLTKMGPILGLMGTLIPMGPALVGLASGDIASMAYNMQVAFATTVVGLVVSAIGFLTQQAKERWALRNLTMLEYLADIVREQPKNCAQ